MQQREQTGPCPETTIDIPAFVEPHVDRLLEARDSRQGMLRCRVKRTREKSLLELFVEEGNVFVLAAQKSGKDWLISEQPGGSTKQYIARLRTHKDRSFTCVRCRDEKREAPSELLFVRHETEQLSDDLPELNTIQLAMPRVTTHGQDAQFDAPSGYLSAQLRRVMESRERCRPEYSVLETRRPKWNPRTDTYELPFAGRANWASARNFQLVEHGGRADAAVLLYGKLEEDEFALDYAAPLSLLHALATVLTTWSW